VNVTMDANKTITAVFFVDIGPMNWVNISVGWNLVSVPDSVTNWTPNVVFPGVYGSMFKFSSGAYVTANLLEKGVGYWAYFTSPTAPKTIPFTGGVYSSPITIPMSLGWNIVGSREVAVAKSALTTNPPGLIYGSMFIFSGGSYVPSTSIPDGSGVWIYVTAPCTLTIP
jgi:hypothetical protein